MGAGYSLQTQIQNALFPKNRPRVEYAKIANIKRTLNRGVQYIYFEKAQPKGEVPKSAEEKVVLVISHGNMETMNSAINSVLGHFPGILDFVAWEYAGYGVRGDEEPSRECIIADAHDIALTFKDRKVIFVGRSLGGFAAIVSALRHRELQGKQKLLLISAFASVMHARPLLSFLAHTEINDFENYKLAKEYDGQVFIAHGDADTVVHVSNAQILKKCFPLSEILIMKGYGHNGLFPYLSQHLSMEKLITF